MDISAEMLIIASHYDLIMDVSQLLTERFSADERDKIKVVYRGVLAKLLRRSRVYDGTEDAYQTILAELQFLEQFVSLLAHGDKEVVPAEVEKAVAMWASMHVPSRALINNILGKSAEALDRNFHRVFAQLCCVVLDKPLLPGDSVSAPIRPGEGGGVAVKFEDRLKPVIAMLQSRGVFADDLVLITGPVVSGAMREVSYIQIDIPRLQRSILVCNQIGESTFVFHGLLPRSIVTMASKFELIATYGDRLCKVEKRGEDQWLAGIEQALFSDILGTNTTRVKVNVVHAERLRKQLSAMITPEQWAAMEQLERQQLKMRVDKDISPSGEVGIMALSSLFGVYRNAGSHRKLHIETGFRIYGLHPALMTVYERIVRHELVVAGDKSAISLVRGMVIEQVPTAEAWIAEAKLNRNNREFDGLKISALATLFGITGFVARSTQPYLELGIKIYGPVDCLTQALGRFLIKGKLEGGDQIERQRILVLIRQRVGAEAEWLSMESRIRKGIKIEGYTFNELATLLGIFGNVIYIFRWWLELGLLVFPGAKKIALAYRQHVVEINALAGSNSARKKMRRIIKSYFNCSRSWLECDYETRLHLRIAGRGITYLGSLFEIGGNPISSTIAYIELGMAVYGQSDPVLAAAYKDAVRLVKARDGDSFARAELLTIVRADCSSQGITDANWIDFFGKAKSLVWAQVGIVRLVTSLGMTNCSAHARVIDFISLGLLIFPQSKILVKRYRELMNIELAVLGNRNARRRIRAQVRAIVGGAQNWRSLSKVERQTLHFGGLAIQGLASAMGVDGDARKLDAHYCIGEIIYGKTAMAATTTPVSKRGRKRS